MKKRLFLFNILAVALGGGLGTVFRYLINLNTAEALFPIGTVIENIMGSFLLGILSGWVIRRNVSEIVRNGLGVGFCGGFTTMSTFAADLVYLFHGHSFFYIPLYLITSIIGGLASALLGLILGSLIAERRQLRERGASE